MRDSLRRRLTILAAAIGLGLAAAPHARAADQVSVQLDWVVRGDHALFFVARDKGFFRENGIDVTAIRRGTGSGDALRLVANGNAQFGFADLPTLMVGRGRDVPDVALVATNQASPLAMIALAKTHQLRHVTDLKGLNVGVDPTGSTYVFLKALLGANGMSLAEIKQSTMSHPYENFLLLGRVDVVPGYVDAEVPELEAKAGGPGSLSVLLGADAGYVAYGSGLFTSARMIHDHPDLVRRFTKAYLEAFRSVVEDPEGAVKITVAANPEYAGKAGVLLAQLKADLASTFFSPDTKAHGIGWIDSARWAATAKMLHDYGGGLADPAKTEGGFDMTFLTDAKPLRR